jgi:hypothetical protein
MYYRKLNDPEVSSSGFTEKHVISFAAGDFSAAALTQTYNLGPALAAGEVIDKAAFKVVTAVSGGAIATATLQVGFTGTTNGFVTATNCFTGASSPVAGDGASLDKTGGKAFTSASQAVAVLTTTTGNVSVATAGEIHIYLRRYNTADV